MPKQSTTSEVRQLEKEHSTILKAARLVSRGDVPLSQSPRLALPSYQEFVDSVTTYGTASIPDPA